MAEQNTVELQRKLGHVTARLHAKEKALLAQEKVLLSQQQQHSAEQQKLDKSHVDSVKDRKQLERLKAKCEELEKERGGDRVVRAGECVCAPV